MRQPSSSRESVVCRPSAPSQEHYGQDGNYRNVHNDSEKSITTELAPNGGKFYCNPSRETAGHVRVRNQKPMQIVTNQHWKNDARRTDKFNLGSNNPELKNISPSLNQAKWSEYQEATDRLHQGSQRIQQTFGDQRYLLEAEEDIRHQREFSKGQRRTCDTQEICASECCKVNHGNKTGFNLNDQSYQVASKNPKTENFSHEVYGNCSRKASGVYHQQHQQDQDQSSSSNNKACMSEFRHHQQEAFRKNGSLLGASQETAENSDQNSQHCRLKGLPDHLGHFSCLTNNGKERNSLKQLGVWFNQSKHHEFINNQVASHNERNCREFQIPSRIKSSETLAGFPNCCHTAKGGNNFSGNSYGSPVLENMHNHFSSSQPLMPTYHSTDLHGMANPHQSAEMLTCLKINLEMSPNPLRTIPTSEGLVSKYSGQSMSPGSQKSSHLSSMAHIMTNMSSGPQRMTHMASSFKQRMTQMSPSPQRMTEMSPSSQQMSQMSPDLQRMTKNSHRITSGTQRIAQISPRSRQATQISPRVYESNLHPGYNYIPHGFPVPQLQNYHSSQQQLSKIKEIPENVFKYSPFPIPHPNGEERISSNPLANQMSLSGIPYPPFPTNFFTPPTTGYTGFSPPEAPFQRPLLLSSQRNEYSFLFA